MRGTESTGTATTMMTTSMTGTTGDLTTTTTVTPTTDPTTGGPTTDPMTSTTTTSPDMTTGTSAPMTSTTGGAELTCDEYCGIYATGCADFTEYDNAQACLDQCSQWPEGALNETAGDTLGCRLYHVTVASMGDASTHCPHAGPSGGGVCVDALAPTCELYCTTYTANCKADLFLYADEADCLAQCGGWYPGKVGDTAGDTVGCRDYHAGVALGDPGLHCPHAGPSGGGVCVVQ